MSLLILGCGKKVNPPGKGEFNPPKIILFSPNLGDTLNGSFNLTLNATDSSGIYKVEVYRRGNILGVFSVRGRDISFDTTVNIPDEGEDFFSDTLEVKVYDRWDNANSVKVEVFTKRKPPKKPEKGGDKNDKGTGNEGGENNRGQTPPKSP